MTRRSFPRSQIVLATCLVAATGCAAKDTGTRPAQIPNPAATFCEENRGTFRIVKQADGSTGMCTLPDGTEVDAWDYFRQSQPPAKK